MPYLAFLLVLTVYLLTLGTPTSHVEVTLQGYCLLHGQISIDGIATAHESVEFLGRHYLIAPPLGAIAMMPFLAIFGVHTNQTLAAGIYGATAAFLVAKLTRSWPLVLLWAFGTSIWYEATTGDSWGFNLILSTIPTLLALEAIGDAKYSKAGFWAGLACLSRFDLATELIIYGIQASLGPFGRYHLRRFLLGCTVPLCLYLCWSLARFRTVPDQAEYLWWLKDGWGYANHRPLLGLSNLSLNLFTWLFCGPSWSPTFPYFRPNRWGQAILLTTPALLLVIRTPLNNRTYSLWIGAAAALIGPALFYNSGWVQFGCRFWIQAFPWLFLLLAKQPVNDKLSRTLIGLSIAINALGLFAIRHGGFAL